MKDWLQMVFFYAGKGGGELIDYGYKGKGVTTHLLTDGNGNPINFEVTSAKGDERSQVEKLLDGIEEFTNRRYLQSELIPIFEADKGYDAEELRNKLLKRKIFPFIPYRRIGAAKKAEKIVCNLAKFRWKVEGPFLGCKENLGDLSFAGKDVFAIGKDF